MKSESEPLIVLVCASCKFQVEENPDSPEEKLCKTGVKAMCANMLIEQYRSTKVSWLDTIGRKSCRRQECFEIKWSLRYSIHGYFWRQWRRVYRSRQGSREPTAKFFGQYTIKDITNALWLMNAFTAGKYTQPKFCNVLLFKSKCWQPRLKNCVLCRKDIETGWKHCT